jgi:hypothetical protein
MTTATSRRIQRAATLKWIPLNLMRVSPVAQRDLQQYRVDHLASNFDVEQIGTLTVNKRGESYFIIDGQHRVEAMRQMGWGDQQVQCWVYEGLTEEEEAARFLILNDTLTVTAVPKFKVAVTAGRPREVAISDIVHQVGYSVSQARMENTIRCVGALVRVYDRSGGKVLLQTLTIIRDSFGTAGMGARLVDGIALLCDRYDLDTETVVARFSNIRGGAAGLEGKAEVIRRQTRQALNHCVAAACVEILNSGQRGGGKLPGWFRVAE